jgi:hypothetical protein
VKKGYLKIHFAVDIRTGQVVSVDVSSKKVCNWKRLKRLVKRTEEIVKVKRVLADEVYDSKAKFNFLAGGIKPVIRFRKGSVPKNRGAVRGSSLWSSSRPSSLGCEPTSTGSGTDGR